MIMNILIYIIIFLIIAITYIHIIYHIKTSNKMEVYDIDYSGVTHLNEICDLRQPFTFRCSKECININKENTITNNTKINIIKKEEVNEKTNKILSHNNDLLVKLPETEEKILNFEHYIKPNFNITSLYDILFADEDMTTNLSYSYNYRNFFHITEGSIIIRFLPPNVTNKINHHTDYELLQEISNVDIWKNNDNFKYVEIKISSNDTLFIPPYWWYSIRFLNPTTIVTFKYRTFMNNVTILPKLLYSYITIHNRKLNLRIKNKKGKRKKKKNVSFKE